MMRQRQSDPQRERLTSLIEGGFDCTRLRRGRVYEATIVSKGDQDILVDLGSKRDGIVPPGDLNQLEERYVVSLQVGDTVPVVVTQVQGRQGECVVSLNKGLEHKDWLRAQDLLESEEVFEGEVTDVNRGGVIVPFGNLRGFVPNSHLTAVPRGLRGEPLRNAKLSLIGRTLPLIVIEVNQHRRRLILSQRRASRRRRMQLLEELVPGDIRSGVVCSLVSFGAFVDLGGLDGLIHISELDWAHVDHPSDVLSVGDRVDVYVINVDRKRERISLSRKRLLPDPWDNVIGLRQVGDMIQGTITHVTSYGAFVNIGEGIEGLVHVSAMPKRDATLASLTPGDSVTVRIVRIDRWKRRIALSMEPDMDVSARIASREGVSSQESRWPNRVKEALDESRSSLV